MLPDRVSNPGPLTYESGALPIALRGPAYAKVIFGHKGLCIGKSENYVFLETIAATDLKLGWVFWVQRPFETVFQSISGRLPKRGRKRTERIDESKNVQTTPTRTYCKCSRPLPYCNPNCRTPRHWKFTQHHRTTRPPHHRPQS